MCKYLACRVFICFISAKALQWVGDPGTVDRGPGKTSIYIPDVFLEDRSSSCCHHIKSFSPQS